MFQKSLQRQPSGAGERLGQRMESGLAIASSPVSVVEEPQRVGYEFERR